MPSARRLSSVSPSWRAAIIGVLASLPATVLINRFPNSEATVGAGAVLVGGAIAGAVANGPEDAGAAGARAGFLGGVTETLVFLIGEGPTVLRPRTQIPFFVFAVVMILCASPLLGWVFGRLGGRISAVVSR
ncbi:DUF5518 domain-containing protein [Halorubrum tebenquichense]|uniref:DUF5518 domain-containing protein n=1 Tax=Halorubrum tebenquichense TaxID=119434 RepID=UPI00137606CB|nr:DUF5518 domain-containing protein [Halorubrum tebenquichense]